jgi:cation diffusion facilitator family transporter
LALKIDREKAGYLEGLASIAINITLFIVKYYYGVLYNSISVIADAFHTLSDSMTSLVVVLGFWIAYREADEEHPFGHGRAEQIAAIVIAVLLAVVGYELADSSYDKLVRGEPLIFSINLVYVLILSTIVKEALARWAYKLGERFYSQSIKSDAWHHRSDAIATGLLTIAIILGNRYRELDGLMGIAISILIMVTAGKIVYEVGSDLLGKAPTKREVEAIKRIVFETHPQATDIHHIHIHRYGDHIEVTLHIKLPENTPLREAHQIATAIENNIRNRLGYEATIHIEPIDASETKT